MKNQTTVLITIIGFFTLIVVLLLTNKEAHVTNVYCGESTVPPLNCNKQRVPEKLTAHNTMLYYKVDDNCNFQTLVFDASKENNAYAVIGRFEGRQIHRDQYQIDKLEAIAYNLEDGSRGHYKVSNVEIKDMNGYDIEFVVELSERKGASFEDRPDYIYDEEPVIIGRNSMIHFETVLVDNPPFISGGYECNGKPVWPPGGP